MKTKFALGLIAALFFYIGCSSNNAKLDAYTAYRNCMIDSSRIEAKRLDVIEYQIQNNLIIYEDYILSRSYIEFLTEKADNICKEMKSGKK